MSALPQCDAFAYIYDQAGDPAPDVLVVLKSVIDANRNPILLSPETTVTDSAGSFHFTLPEFARATIAARATGLWDCPDGRDFQVPAGPSGELIPDFSLPSSTLVEPPLVYVGDVLSIPKASETQDGYLSAADYVAFLAGATSDMGVVSFNTRTGEIMLLSNDVRAALGYVPLNKDGDSINGPLLLPGNPTLPLHAAPRQYVDAHSLQNIPGVAGTYPVPTSITINNKGQVIAITAGTPDVTPPNITAIVATPGATSVAITWHTNEPADSQVEYGTSMPPPYDSATPPTDTDLPVTDHVVTISGLNPTTPYHYRVKSKDPAGNLKVSADGTFTTTAAADTTPPVITLAATPVTVITGTSATINWTTDEASDSQVDYSTDLLYGTSTPPTDTSPRVTTHAVHLTSLAPLTTYNYRVQSKDAATPPNAATPVTGSFMTAAPPDVTPPVITLAATPVTGITGSAATINWTTNELADSEVTYSADPDVSYGTPTVPPITNAMPPGPGVATHAVSLTSLIAGQLYHYKVKSKDAAGNPAIPVTGTFNTTAPPVDLLTDLLSYWKLDEAGSATSWADSAAGGINTLTRAGTLTPVTSHAGFGTAPHFGGDGSRLTIPSNSGLVMGSAVDYTIAAWVQLADNSIARCALGKGGTGFDEYLFQYAPNPDDCFTFAVKGATAYHSVLANTIGPPLLNTWYLLVCWHDAGAGTINIQVNGGVIFSAVQEEPPVTGADGFQIGTYGDGAASFWNGLIDEVAIWKNRILNASERAALWNGGAGKPFDTW